jgi:flagellar basal body rod protein FlgB
MNTTEVLARQLDLRIEREEIFARALAITDKPKLTAADRKQFEELLELLGEIQDYSARLNRRGEKWRIQ